ncbi:division/cell wall cluster transcriptional repressor MraZ [Candidatus Beckwithbacteria bacterium CG10_big_fil_rev_8_21_14_0_10_34_10]|uniref:Transcriptional regulator MraZ n=1 Tax=Candidatus Beckwithbacteria bacterium CG10_big_fil_rev_8_21_14_0_10_34_10 TaxID=1974495 RepID=A0A2H0W917_9BACT|nr:MAG: division/cell wall cluster transcriptional repressor MraZ [Candidatus Beckwithbacteria bacterium CG10_big_fil_rev_8_21_14_0_10_34_10]
MLIGNFSAKLDSDKGRTALPAKFRSLLGKKVIITAGFEKSLMIVKYSSWEKVAGGIVNKPFISGAARETDRYLLGNAFEIELDSQGRFIVPPPLRSYASLGEQIVFVGMGNRVEMWNLNDWEEHQEYLKGNIEKISQRLDEGDQK